MKQCRLTQSTLKYLHTGVLSLQTFWKEWLTRAGFMCSSVCLMGYLPAGVCSGNVNWSYFHLQITWFYRWFAPPHPIKFHLIPTIYKSLYSLQSTLTFFALGFSSHQYDVRIIFFQTKTVRFFSFKTFTLPVPLGKKWINESLADLVSEEVS